MTITAGLWSQIICQKSEMVVGVGPGGRTRANKVQLVYCPDYIEDGHKINFVVSRAYEVGGGGVCACRSVWLVVCMFSYVVS